MAEDFYHCTYYHFTSDTIHRALPCMKIMKRLFSRLRAKRKLALSAAEEFFILFCLKYSNFFLVTCWAFFLEKRINLIKSTKLTFSLFLSFLLLLLFSLQDGKVFLQQICYACACTTNQKAWKEGEKLLFGCGVSIQLRVAV